RRVEVRLWSHLRFAEEEPESDEVIRELANVFGEPFGNYLREYTGGTAGAYITLSARRTSSGVAEMAFYITYFSLQAAVGAPVIFQLASGALDELAKLQWARAGRSRGYPISDSENRITVVDGAHIALNTKAPPIAENSTTS